MLFKYNIKDKNFEPLNEVTFASLKIFERYDIEKWIEGNPDVVGEDLFTISTEYDKFDKTKERLDILAVDKEGKIVIIELKRDDSGKDAELQAIKYAAYCSTLTLEDIKEMRRKYLEKKGKAISLEQAEKDILDFIENPDFKEIDDKPRIILVAREFRPEVTASVLWLRNFQLDISCVKITPYSISDNELGVYAQKIIPLPDAEEYIVKVEKKDSGERILTVNQKAYLNFWKKVKDEFEKKVVISLSDPRPISYYQIPSGVGSIHFEWLFQSKLRRFGVELHFEKGSKEANLRYLKSLKKYIPELEKLIGQPVEIMEHWSKNWSRMFVQMNDCELTDEVRQFAVEKMVVFYDYLRPKLAELK
ncbi:MAG: DUF4268 domain-containing protein [Syntrophales bacterium]